MTTDSYGPPTPVDVTAPSAPALRVTKTSAPTPHGELPRTSYRIDTPWAQYQLAKEFYAHGPSMFTWVLTCPGTDLYQDFNTKGLALDWVALQAPPDQSA